MSVIGDLDDFESAARGRQVLRQVAETYIFSQPAQNTSKRTQLSSCSRDIPMEQSNLMSVVTRPLSPDAKIEVLATWAEYEYVRGYLDNEGSKFPRLWYDSSCQLATVIAAPIPLHSDMVGELVDHFADTCRDIMRRRGISENIWEGGIGSISYVVNDDPKLMVAFEVGCHLMVVCALHCRLGIAMNITEKDRGERPTVKYYASRQEQGAVIQHARSELRLQLRRNPFGPLEWNNITWFGKLREVVIETFRNENPNCPPEALLEPTQSLFPEHWFPVVRWQFQGAVDC
ncbi:hypothetical protein V1522DRAFT_459697 [Lipomyces starkeyi]